MVLVCWNNVYDVSAVNQVVFLGYSGVPRGTKQGGGGGALELDFELFAEYNGADKDSKVTEPRGASTIVTCCSPRSLWRNACWQRLPIYALQTYNQGPFSHVQPLQHIFSLCGTTRFSKSTSWLFTGEVRWFWGHSRESRPLRKTG